jgi:hypothetical protein
MTSEGGSIPGQLDSETSSVTTVVPGAQPGDDGVPGRGEAGDGAETQGVPKEDRWLQRVNQAFMEAEDSIVLYKGIKVNRHIARGIQSSADTVTKVFREAFEHCDEDVQSQIRNYRRHIREVLVGIAAISFDSPDGSPNQRQNGTAEDPNGQSSSMRDNTNRGGGMLPLDLLQLLRLTGGMLFSCLGRFAMKNCPMLNLVWKLKQKSSRTCMMSKFMRLTG